MCLKVPTTERTDSSDYSACKCHLAAPTSSNNSWGDEQLWSKRWVWGVIPTAPRQLDVMYWEDFMNPFLRV